MPIKTEGGVVIYQMHFGLPKYLLVHLQNGEWGFPKGPLNKKGDRTSFNDLRTVAIRSTKRQTNLSVTIRASFHETVRYRSHRGQPHQVTFFLSRVRPHVIVTPPKRLVMNYGWFDFRTAYRTLDYDDLRNVFYDANQFIRQD